MHTRLVDKKFHYRLTNREFSRIWRRSKRYSEHEIKWLARKRGFSVRYEGLALQVYDAKSGKTVANFERVEDKISEKEKKRARQSAVR